MPEFNAGVFGCELAIGFGVVFVTIFFPGCDFLEQGCAIGNAAVETLASQHGEFGLGHIEPTAVFGRVVPFEAFNDSPGKWASDKSLSAWAQSTEVRRSVILTCRQPSSGANIIKRLAVPLRSYS